ncbi:hypothetical protein BG011_007735 [Mortierella polycephala]|uniref:Uncharacterized protein n=1 Tax=Mortierella polycephala TaxID=41804 RepID=A0A9P6PRZ2_9FUNG|nr:hypothetical protein BG011_007735 [Mortierella polycephala]
MVCTVAGDSSVAWGGKTERYRSKSAREWTNESRLVTPDSELHKSSKEPKESKKSTGINGTIIGGGVAGAVFVIAIEFFV